MLVKLNNIYIYWSSSFLFKSTLVASISCICSYKPLSSALWDYESFLPSAQWTITSIVIKIVDLDSSCKHVLEWIGFLVVIGQKMLLFVLETSIVSTQRKMEIIFHA